MRIVAEIGINHQGRFQLAKELVRTAADCGAWGVKFQLYTPSKVFADDDLRQEAEMCKLTTDEYVELFQYAQRLGLRCGASVFDKDWFDWYVERFANYDFVKLASRVVQTDKDLAQYVIDKTKGEVIASVHPSMVSFDGNAMDIVEHQLDEEVITRLLCVSDYPANEQDYLDCIFTDGMNLFETVPPYYNGISDHTQGIDLALFCIAHGASIIEKHFTLDKTMYGSDHICSMTPHELELLVKVGKRLERVAAMKTLRDY